MLQSNLQYTGIIKTMPSEFVFKEYGARRFLRDFYYRLNDPDTDWCFMFTLSAIPKFSVLHFYLLVAGRIRYRANIAEIEGPSTKKFSGGRTISGRAWATITGPVVRSPFVIEMKGFRGFRYTEDLW